MEWISVEDRLPEEGQRVIYYFKHTGISIGRYTRAQWNDPETGEVVSEGDMFHGPDGFLTDDVTHWMPLPDAPDED